jgi:hypothetical protein
MTSTAIILGRFTTFLQRNKVSIILTAATIILYNLFPRDELRSLVLLGMLIPIFAVYRFSPGVPIGFGILCLVIAAGFTSVKNETYAAQMAISSFLLLVVGVACLLIELIRKERNLTQQEMNIGN